MTIWIEQLKILLTVFLISLLLISAGYMCKCTVYPCCMHIKNIMQNILGEEK